MLSIPKYMAETVAEQSTRSSPLWVWIGFVFALAFLLLEMVYVFMDLKEALIGDPYSYRWK